MTGEAYRGRKKGLYFRRYLLGLHTNCLGYVLGFLIFRLIVAFVLVVIWVVLDFRPMVLAFPPILKFLLIVALIDLQVFLFFSFNLSFLVKIFENRTRVLNFGEFICCFS